MAFPNTNDRIQIWMEHFVQESHTGFVWMELGAASEEAAYQSTLAFLPRILEEEKEKFCVTSFTVMLLAVQ